MQPHHWPTVHIVLPVFQEGESIGAKIANLAALDYPRERLVVQLVDGDSTDETVPRARAAAARAGIALDVAVARGGKVPQLNAAFSRNRSDFVLVTDADARLDPGALRAMVAAARRGPGALVGTLLRPASPLAIERGFWRASNVLRRLERRVLGSAGLVLGPCYLMRRDLARPLPDSVVADDVFVTLRALAAGERVEVVNVHVVELRGPRDAREFLRHKVRKARGYLHEIWRFLPHAGRMPRAGRVVFFGRIMLLVAVPWGTAAGFAVAAARWPAVGFGLALATLLATGVAFVARDTSRVARAAAWCSLLPVATLVLTVAAATIERRTHGSRYPKVTLFPEPEV
jgi:cellulose synthase/poly-beta-1,6-N-acetylglucosamine synthase-like glycosyltransferase